MKTVLKFISALAFLLWTTSTIQAQITIGSDYSPNKGSLLDIKENNNEGANSDKGLLLPRVMLENLESLSPAYTGSDANEIKAHAGLVVYNLKEDLDKGLCKGLYVWTESTWVRLPDPCKSAIDPELVNTPNSYIVAPGASVVIPVAKPYLVWGVRNGLESISGKVSTDLLWQDKTNLITEVNLLNNKDDGANSSIEVKTSPSVKGNAVVAVRVGPNGNSSDPVRWSWHIWVTDTPQEYTTRNAQGVSYVFMDRSLGAINTSSTDAGSIGLLYQWGRKDPFPGPLGYGVDADLNEYGLAYDINGNLTAETTANGIQHVAVVDDVNLANSIMYPKNYYYNPTTGALGDWYTLTESNQDNSLWLTADGKKSLFDPCPSGWRVPEARSGSGPWSLYVDDGWGWGDPVYTPVGVNGFMLGASGSTSYPLIGYYPRIFYRNGQNYIKNSHEGGNGGEFSNPDAIINDMPFWSACWTANVGSTVKNGNSVGISSGGLPTDFFGARDMPRATGLSVRCVRE